MEMITVVTNMNCIGRCEKIIKPIGITKQKCKVILHYWQILYTFPPAICTMFV